MAVVLMLFLHNGVWFLHNGRMRCSCYSSKIAFFFFSTQHPTSQRQVCKLWMDAMFILFLQNGILLVHADIWFSECSCVDLLVSNPAWSMGLAIPCLRQCDRQLSFQRCIQQCCLQHFNNQAITPTILVPVCAGTRWGTQWTFSCDRQALKSLSTAREGANSLSN